MGEMIWVEVLRHRAVATRYRCAGPVVRIGRGYGNDVVLDDPEIAPDHVRIARDDTGALIATDLGSRNGMFADGERQRREHITLDGNVPIRIGTTFLRVRDETYRVPPEPLATSAQPGWPLPLGLGILLVVMSVLLTWFGESGEPQAFHYILPALTVVLVALGWAGLWAIASYGFSGQARFPRHLVIGMCGLLAFAIANQADEYAAYCWGWHASSAGQSLGLWTGLAVVGFLHLRVIGPTRLALKAGAVAALAVIAIAIQWLSLLAQHVELDQASVASRLFPPELRLAREQTEDTFFQKADQLKKDLDADRAKPL